MGKSFLRKRFVLCAQILCIPGSCLQVRAEGEELVVTADAYARSVEIHNAEDDMLLEDNYFDMDAGTRRVKIREGKPEGLTIRSVYDIR